MSSLTSLSRLQDLWEPKTWTNKTWQNLCSFIRSSHWDIPILEEFYSAPHVIRMFLLLARLSLKRCISGIHFGFQKSSSYLWTFKRFLISQHFDVSSIRDAISEIFWKPSWYCVRLSLIRRRLFISERLIAKCISSALNSESPLIELKSYLQMLSYYSTGTEWVICSSSLRCKFYACWDEKFTSCFESTFNSLNICLQLDKLDHRKSMSDVGSNR